MSEEVKAEEVIIPTLAFAAETSQGVVSCLEAKERVVAARQTTEADGEGPAQFSEKFGEHRIIGVVDDVLILEKLPLSCGIHPELETWGQVLQATITVALSGRLPMPERVAELYRETLAAENVACSGSGSGSISFDFFEDSLILNVGHNVLDPQWLCLRDYAREGNYAHLSEIIRGLKPQARFPHPGLVQQFYRTLITNDLSNEGVARHPTVRKRGRAWEPINLIPACVAFCLKYYGRIYSPKEVHKLLNEHVPRGASKTLPEDGVSSSESVQLWRNVKRVGPRLLQESRLHLRHHSINTNSGE